MLFKVPGGAYATVTAASADVSALTFGGHDAYQGFADVTSRVRATGAGTYTVANVQAGTGQDRYASWSLVVAYRDPAGKGRNLTVFDGLAAVGSGNNQTVNVSGFRTPSTGAVNATVGVVNYESDLGITGDSATLSSGGVSTPLQDALTKVDNFSNSAVEEGGVRTTTKSPDYSNNLGVDAKLLKPPSGSIPNGATSASIAFNSTGDVYFPGVITIATDLYSPHIQPVKTATDISNSNLGGNPINARPGDTVRYEIAATNTGEDGAAGVVMSDQLPAGVTYVPGSLKIIQDTANPGSVGAKTDAADGDVADRNGGANTVTFRLGSGASSSAGGSMAPNASFRVSFDVTVDRSLSVGTKVDNVGSVTYSATSNPAFQQTNSSSPPTSLNVAAAPDLSVGITRDRALVRGAQTNYTVTASNGGTGPTDTTPATTIVTTFPTGETPGTVSSAPGWTCSTSGQTVTCTRSNSLAAGSAHPGIVIPVTVAQDAPGSLTARATVNGGGDTTPGNNAVDNTAPVSSSADLAVSQTAAPATADPDTNVTFTVRVDNNGPSAAAGVQLANSLPAGLTLVSASPSQGSCTGSSCALGALANGAHATITVVAHVAPSAQGQTLTNQATTTTTTPDPNRANDAASASVTVSSNVRLTLNLTGTPSTVNPGDNVTYTLVAHNAGPANSTGTTITNTLPNGMTFVSGSPGCTASGQVVTCPAGTLAPGEDATATIVAQATIAIQGQTVTDAGQVTSQQPNTDPSAGAATTLTNVRPVADLALSDTASGDPVAGQPLTYTLTLINNGPSAATSTLIEDRLPAGVTFVSANAGQGTCSFATGVVSCQVGTLPVGASTQVTIVVTPQASAVGNLLTDAASASSAEHNPTPAAASSSATVLAPPAVPVKADLTVSAPTPAGPVSLGRPTDYLVTVTNNGPDPAQAATLLQTFAGPIHIVGVTVSQGSCTTSAGVQCMLGDIPPGGSVTLRVRLTPQAAGKLTSATSVTSATDDPQLDNNQATQSVTVRGQRASVRMTVRPSVRRAHPGQRLTLTVTTANRGPGAARHLQVCIRLPAGLIFLRSSNAVFRSGQICWPPRTLNAHRSTRHTVLVEVSPTARPGRLVATAGARASNARTARALGSIQVAGRLAVRGGGVTG